METMNFDLADNMNHHIHDMSLFHSDQPAARPDGDDDNDNDDQEEDDDNAMASNSDGDPAMDQKVVHSPLPTDDGGKPKK